MTWSADGERLAYHTGGQGDPIFVADRMGNNPAKLFAGPPGTHCHYLGWSADNRYIYFSHGEPAIPEMDLWRVSLEGGRPERITRQYGDPRYPTSLDNDVLLYTGPAGDGSGPWLWAVHAGRGVSRRVTVGTEQYTSIAASADRRRLVATVANPTSGLWTIPIGKHPVEESSAKRYTSSSIRVQGPRYGKDYYVYLSSKGTGYGIWKFQNGLATELWKAVDGAVTYPPAISPDGRQICFSYRKQGRTGLYVMTSDGNGVRPLGESIDVRGSAAWSPDSTWIAVGGIEGETRGLFLVPVAGGAPKRLVDKPSSNPVWSPDGSVIVYCVDTVGRYQTINAVRPDGAPFQLPKPAFSSEIDQDLKGYPKTGGLRVRFQGERIRFLPDGSHLVFMAGSKPWQQFYLFNMARGEIRKLSNLQTGFIMRTFDVSPDGKTILFDRMRENSDIVLIELNRK